MTPEELPPMLRVTPSLDRWLTFTNGEVIAHTGRVELGQGVRTAIAILVAEQLEVALDRVVVPDPTTASAPIEGVTAGSMSMEVGGAALRQAAAWAKRLLLKRAAEALGCPVSRLTVRNGELLTDGEQTDIDYWDVAGDGFDFEMVEPTAERMSDAYPGHVRRVDLEARLRGGAFVHDVAADLHARVVRPPSIFIASSSVTRRSWRRVGSFAGKASSPSRIPTNRSPSNWPRRLPRALRGGGSNP